MYIGHIGVALGARGMRGDVSLLVVLIATYAPDWVDSGLCIMGAYDPLGMLSHSVPAIALLATVAFSGYAIVTRDWRSGMVVAGVVVSHALLDFITGYKPTWPGGPMIGLGLYGYPLADLAAEGLVIVIGIALYSRTLPRRRRPWIDIATMLVALLGIQVAVTIATVLTVSLSKC